MYKKLKLQGRSEKIKETQSTTCNVLTERTLLFFCNKGLMEAQQLQTAVFFFSDQSRLVRDGRERKRERERGRERERKREVFIVFI